MPSAAPIVVRSGTPADALCLGMLATQVFLDTYATEGIRPDLAREALGVHSHEAFVARLADSQVHFLIAESGAHLVAFAEVAFGRACPVPHAAEVEVVRLYVQRRFHRRGIGRLLSAGAERLAVARGAAGLWLTAWSGNREARAFYAALAFEDIGHTAYVIENQSYENRVFAKRLCSDLPGVVRSEAGDEPA